MRPRPPLRILLALGLTVVAVVVLLGTAIFDGNDDVGTSTTTSSSTTMSIAAAPTSAAPDTTVRVAPDWYPKSSSRYSDRRPAVTITTLAPTTTEDPES